MVIFKYELRQLRRYIFWWSAACAVLIFAMLPTYMSFLTADTIDVSLIADSSLFEMLGVDPAIISTPLGTFGFLTSFFSIAAGISGSFLGISAFSKEAVGKSAEFLYTTPHKRGSIFCSKVCAALVASAAIGTGYYAGSLLSARLNIIDGFSLRAFSLIACSFTLIEVFFVLLGALIGSVYPKIRTPLLLSGGITFLFYIVSSLASKAHLPAVRFFTPYSYFPNTAILLTGSYELPYLAAFLGLCVIFTVSGYVIFIRKDITFIS